MYGYREFSDDIFILSPDLGCSVLYNVLKIWEVGQCVYRQSTTARFFVFERFFVYDQDLRV